MKEIITNGKDISEWILKGVLIPTTECKYFKGIGDCEENKKLCVDNKNCYFKQLQRLKQENEDLKFYIDSYKVADKIKKLEKENKQLKADLKAETEQAQKWYQRETDKHYIAIKYKQALEDIREIAKCRIENLLIVEKINEVLNEN